MAFRTRIAAVLGFKPVPTTILALLVYAAIYIAVIVTDDLRSVPNDQHGLYLEEAYADLHLIAGQPHPYNSHRNDVVRTYILERVEAIANASSTVHIDNDLSSNATWFSGGHAVYFEGMNVLVKVDGTRPELDGVLFSAHFDSVSTAPGATDNGLSIVTMIQLVQYFSEHQPERTLVFNFNNGEEDGLSGAHSFLEHKWLPLVKTFINFDGAGAGGRPVLLRTTDAVLARALSNAPHSHGTVMSSDLFATGNIRSSTDYSIYHESGMKGLDYVYYRQRSKYHTSEDSIPSIDGGRKALWALLESAQATALALAEASQNAGGGNPVYFDLFGEVLVVTSTQTFFNINIVLLSAGPFLVGLLIYMAHSKGKLYWSKKGWGRFPAALAVSAVLTFGLGILYREINPFIVHSASASVLTSCLLMSFLGFYATIKLDSYFRPVPQQRSIVLLESYAITWLALLVSTIVIAQNDVGGLYFVTFLHAGILGALFIGMLEHFELPTAVRYVPITPPAAPEPQGNDREDDEDESVPSNETTPLLRRDKHVITKDDIDEDNQIGLWFLQFLLAVPFTVIIVTEAALMLIHGANQSLVDGSSPKLIYDLIPLVALLTIWPATPFLHKIHFSVSILLLFVLIGTVLYNVFAFPFSSEAPFKVFFQQTINLDNSSNKVALAGANPFIQSYVLPEIPSSWNQTVICGSQSAGDNTSKGAGLPLCKWHGPLPTIVSTDIKDWFSLKLRSSPAVPGSGTIILAPKNSRNCRIYFDTDITNFNVEGSNDQIQKDYPIPEGGIRELRLWSRTWERKFVVNVRWEGSAGLSGRVACGWNNGDGGLNALDEVMSFLPRWTVLTKSNDALLEGWKEFSL